MAENHFQSQFFPFQANTQLLFGEIWQQNFVWKFDTIVQYMVKYVPWVEIITFCDSKTHFGDIADFINVADRKKKERTLTNLIDFHIASHLKIEDFRLISYLLLYIKVHNPGHWLHDYMYYTASQTKSITIHRTSQYVTHHTPDKSILETLTPNPHPYTPHALSQLLKQSKRYCL